MQSLLLLLLLNGCMHPTTADYDQQMLERMWGYRTYTVDSAHQESDKNHLGLTEIVDRRIVRAINQSMQARGLTENDPNPDFRIRFFVRTKERTDVQDLSLVPGYSRSRSGGKALSGHPAWALDQYEEGTLVVDFIDSASQQLVWRGTYTKRLGQSAPNEAAIKSMIETMLEKYPPFRGQP